MKPHFKPYEIDQYIDGELNAEERTEFENRLASDPELRQNICVQRQLKARIAQHYKTISLPSRLAYTPPQSTNKTNTPWRYAAAGLLGLVLGLLISMSSSQLNALNSPSKADKFVIHLDNNDPYKMQASLQKASQLLTAKPSNQVQIITNHEGIELLNAEGINADQILRLVQQHQNLELVACQRTLERMEREGQAFQLIPAVQVNEPAVDEVVKRLKSGWTFIKI
jgi:intracellular sulfur oxidation DsrE/DsrF family protein